jgi:hypothetical protein
MNYGGKILSDMEGLIRLLTPQCDDRTTIDALNAMLSERRTWSKAHDLFDKIRAKTLVAERSGNRRLVSQYQFEEICAKTLFNLSRANAPFDPDSPYRIIPNAIAFARLAGVADAQVIGVVAA